jgi:hypothetical protein
VLSVNIAREHLQKRKEKSTDIIVVVKELQEQSIHNSCLNAVEHRGGLASISTAE